MATYDGGSTTAVGFCKFSTNWLRALLRSFFSVYSGFMGGKLPRLKKTLFGIPFESRRLESSVNSRGPLCFSSEVTSPVPCVVNLNFVTVYRGIFLPFGTDGKSGSTNRDGDFFLVGTCCGEIVLLVSMATSDGFWDSLFDWLLLGTVLPGGI